MNFSQLAKCPFCGNEEFYNKMAYRGTGLYFSNFDGSEMDNTNMYDCVSSKTSGRAYCSQCHRYLGNSFLGTLSKKTEAALAGEEQKYE